MSRPGFRRSSAGGLGAQARGMGGGGGEDIHVTGAPFSQAQILHLMKTEFSRARRYAYPLSVVLMRVDRIGSLVELHGAEARDAIKRALGRIVAEKTRDHDHVGLLSEDRYLLVLPHAGPREAGLVGERFAHHQSPLAAIGSNREQVCIGAIGFGLSQLLFVYNVVRCTQGKGAEASSEVWDNPAGLEWTVPSPAPYHTFETPPQTVGDSAK